MSWFSGKNKSNMDLWVEKKDKEIANTERVETIKKEIQEAREVSHIWYVSHKKEVRRVVNRLDGYFYEDGDSFDVWNPYMFKPIFVYVTSLPGNNVLGHHTLLKDSKIDLIQEKDLFETEKEAQMELIRIERFEKPKKKRKVKK